MTISIDFDGTIVKHRYPEIGESIGAEPVLKALVNNGHQLILNTMRGHKKYDGRDLLEEAVNWFKDNDIELWGVNENPDQKTWTDSPKIYADIYIDDAALGCPKKFDERRRTGYVDWDILDNWFKSVGIINTIID